MDNPIFKFETTMEKEDYKKFLYTATFKRNKFVIPIIALIAMLGALFVAFSDGTFNLTVFFICWIFMFVSAIGVICFKVERRNKQRIKTDKTGTFGSRSILSFFEDKLIFETPTLNSTGTLTYNQVYKLMESKDYFIFYITYNQATLLRKKDIGEVQKFREFIVSKFANKYNLI